ncbi:hypothetical protein M103_2675 [Bacteroides fragilis str. 1007-1-F |nr:hypothetical protein M100_2636 [Bacteroides fragilis str. 1007-1-F \
MKFSLGKTASDEQYFLNEKAVSSHQQFPPRLFTMRTRAELIFLYTYGSIY